MLSRVAESIYWMSRFVERAENVARFIHVNLHLMLDLPDDDGAQWQPLVDITGDHAMFRQRYVASTRDNVIQFLTFDRDNPNSIASCLWKARENARSVREMISSEMFEQVNRFYLMVRDAATDATVPQSPHHFFTQVKMASHLFTGITDTTLAHGEGWHFSRMGRLFERADKTSRILDVKYYLLLPRVEDVGTPLDVLQWSALLRSASAFEMYRKRHHRIVPRCVAEFLILDRDFPRSLYHCLLIGEWSLHEITGAPPDTFSNPAERRLGRLRSELAYAQIDDVFVSGLHEYLDAFQTRLNEVDDAVFETFFALRPVPS